MAILHTKLESAKKQVSILQQDLDTTEKRLEMKNEIIIQVEEKVKNQNAELLKFQDEILVWKLHASRSDDSLVKSNKAWPINVNDLQLKDRQHITKQTQGKTDSNLDVQQSKTDGKQINHLSDNKCTDRKKIMLIGTSNLNYINPKRMSNVKIDIEKVTEYTIDQGQEFVEALNSEIKLNVIGFHLLENDISTQTPVQCAEKLYHVWAIIQKKMSDTKIIVSLGLPQSDANINRNVKKLNALIRGKLEGNANITLNDNGNLFYRGNPSRGVLGKDGKHLSRFGTKRLAANLKSVIYDVLGEQVTLKTGNRKYYQERCYE